MKKLPLLITPSLGFVTTQNGEHLAVEVEKPKSAFRGNDCKYYDSSSHRCALWIKTGCEECAKFLKK